jgi:pyrrolidone-carboxylate peptidase
MLSPDQEIFDVVQEAMPDMTCMSHAFFADAAVLLMNMVMSIITNAIPTVISSSAGSYYGRTQLMNCPFLRPIPLFPLLTA